jgi:hypothetical protein
LESLASPCEIYGGQNDPGTGFSPGILVFQSLSGSTELGGEQFEQFLQHLIVTFYWRL